VLQPVIVSRIGDGISDSSQENALEASSLAGLKRIPALIKEVSSQDAIEIALIENIQREELNAIETATLSTALCRTSNSPRSTRGAGGQRQGNSRQLSSHPEAAREIKALINDGSLSLDMPKPCSLLMTSKSRSK